MFKKLYLLFLILLPKNTLSRFVGFCANKSFSKAFIPWFAKRYKINLEEAEFPIGEYPTLNQFFTRKLKPGRRPITGEGKENILISPVDGKIAQFGNISEGKLIQAKGKTYTLTELIGNKEEASLYKEGKFMTIYLAPTDYHRMHHYADGKITGYRYLPGKLFPVNEFSVANVENLFPINERFNTYYDCNGRKTGIVKVGATVVGKIKVTYCEVESNISKQGAAGSFNEPIEVKKGDELGLFAMGSTVVMLFEKDAFEFENFELGQKVQLGQKLGEWVK